MLIRQIALVSMIVAWSTGIVCAQDAYPVRPIRMIVPFGAGSGPDAIARRLAPRLTEHLGQPVIVENRAGGGGIIGTDAAAKAPADGYTIALAAIGTLASGALHAQLPYDPARSFAPIALHYTAPFALFASPTAQVETLDQLLSLARAKPGALTFASQGNGSAAHLAAELFAMAAGVQLRHIPYKEFGQVIRDLSTGRVDLFFDAAGIMYGPARSGSVRAIATSGAARSKLAPDLPTFREAGLAGYDMTAWLGIVAPDRTPPAVVDRLNAAVNAAIAAPELQQWAAQTGSQFSTSTPDQFARHLEAEIEKWTRVISAAGIRAD